MHGESNPLVLPGVFSPMTLGYHKPSNTSQDWCTPPKYVDAVRYFFGGAVGLDPCSNNHSTVRADVEWSLPEVDGLFPPWNYPTIFVNPPYGRDSMRRTSIFDWLSKWRGCSEALRVGGPGAGSRSNQHPPLEEFRVRNGYRGVLSGRHSTAIPYGREPDA